MNFMLESVARCPEVILGLAVYVKTLCIFKLHQLTLISNKLHISSEEKYKMVFDFKLLYFN